MFETIIVPLDGWPHAEYAIPYAIDEARRHLAKMVLIHVIPRPEPCTSAVRRSGPLPWQGAWPEEIEPAKCSAEAYLHGVVTRYGLDPETISRVAIGDPGVRVAAAAARYPQPLVVMLTGDCTRVTRPPLSLVTSYLLIAGAVPVLGIRHLPPQTSASSPRQSGSATDAPRRTHPGPALMPSPMQVRSPVPG